MPEHANCRSLISHRYLQFCSWIQEFNRDGVGLSVAGVETLLT